MTGLRFSQPPWTVAIRDPVEKPSIQTMLFLVEEGRLG